MNKVLLVEPDRVQARLFQSVLSGSYDVSWARTTQGAITALDKKSFDVVITETSLDHHNGIELLAEIRSYEDWTTLPIIFLSALPKERFSFTDSDWKDFNVRGFISKAQFNKTEFLQVVQEATG